MRLPRLLHVDIRDAIYLYGSIREFCVNYNSIFDIHLDQQGTDYRVSAYAVEGNLSLLESCILLPYSASARVRASVAHDIILTEMLFTW